MTEYLEGSCVGLGELLYKILPIQTKKDNKIFKLVKVVKIEAPSKSESPFKVSNNNSQESNGRR
jgi:hypothetical protein